MRARAILSSYLQRSLTLSRFPTKLFIPPAYDRFTRNSFVSPAYAKTGGVYTHKNVGAPTFSLSFLPIFTLGPLAFQSFAHSFIFRIQPISHPSNIFRTLVPKTGGTPPLVQPIPPFLYLINLLYLLFLHSPPIHNPVTAPSPILLPLLSQSSPVRGPTLTPCLSLSECLRYTSTNAIRSARFLHETCPHH